MAERKARHEAVAHFERTGAILPGEAARIALFLSTTNGDQPDDRTADSIPGP